MTQLVDGNKVKAEIINSTGYEKRLVEILTETQERGEETVLRILNYIKRIINRLNFCIL
jgi:hypothetical protein